MSAQKLEIKRPKLSGWGYALGLIASRETQLMTEADLDRLYQAQDLVEFADLCRDFGYEGDDLAAVLDQAQYDDIDLLQEISPEPKLLEIFLLANDFHNLKAVLKVQLTGSDQTGPKDWAGLLRGPYSVEPDLFRDSLDEKRTDLESTYYRLVQEVEQNWFTSYDLSRLDLLVEQTYWQSLFQKLDTLANDWLTDYYKLKAYLINLEIVLRGQVLQIKPEPLADNLIDLDREFFLDLFASDRELLVQKLQTKDSRLVDLAEVAGRYGQPQTAAEFAAAADNILASHIRSARSGGASLERIASYFFARQLERKNIELARLSLINRLSTDRVQKIRRSLV